jgi:hypothetical protein
LELVKQATQGLDVVVAEAGLKLLGEADHCLEQASMKGVAGTGQLDLDGAPVRGSALALDESGLLDAVEVAG